MRHQAWARLVVLAGLLGLACCAPRRSNPGAAGDGARAGGSSSLRDSAPAEPEPRGVIISPAGRRVQRGSVDPLGYVLPLDVLRERPGRRTGERPPVRAGERHLGPTPPFPETRLGTDDGHTQNETSIDADADTLVAGWHNYTDTGVVLGAGRSTDSGQSWSWELLGGHASMSDPVVKAGKNGSWYFGYIASGGPGGSDVDVYVRRSTDAGASWQAPVAVTDNTGFDDKPYLAARGDEVVVAYADFAFSPAKVRVARSLDGALSFANDTILANNSVAGNGACPVIAPDGSYLVFWRDSFQEFLWMSRSVDQGQSWSPDRSIVAMSPLPATMPAGFRMVNLPSAAAHPLTGELVVVWNDQRFGDADILSIRSSDSGASWSEPIRVNDDASGRAQFFPWLTIDEAGVVHVVWYDQRENGSDIDVYYARSLDGGLSYEPNVRVTARAFTPILPWDTSLPFIGDYNGIAASGGRAYAFYQDAREGNQDVYVALLADTPCDVMSIGPVGLVRAVKLAGGVDLRLGWRPEAEAGDGYNVWYVTAKGDLPACGSCGPASRLVGCSPTGGPGLAACTDPALPGPPGELRLYNVRGVCQGSEARN